MRSTRSRARTPSAAGRSRTAKDDITLLYPTSPTSIARAQILKYNLEQIGLSVTLKPQPFAVALRTAGHSAPTSTRS